MQNFQYITANPEILGGKPCVKGTRISIALVLEWLANGAKPEEIQEEYPKITQAVMLEIFRYAAKSLKNEIVLDAEKVA